MQSEIPLYALLGYVLQGTDCRLFVNLLDLVLITSLEHFLALQAIKAKDLGPMPRQVKLLELI